MLSFLFYNWRRCLSLLPLPSLPPLSPPSPTPFPPFPHLCTSGSLSTHSLGSADVSRGNLSHACQRKCTVAPCGALMRQVLYFWFERSSWSTLPYYTPPPLFFFQYLSSLFYVCRNTFRLLLLLLHLLLLLLLLLTMNYYYYYNHSPEVQWTGVFIYLRISGPKCSSVGATTLCPCEIR